MSEIPLAARTDICVCPNGCPVIVFVNAAGEYFAAAHVPADHLETFVKMLRAAKADGEAMQRPPA